MIEGMLASIEQNGYRNGLITWSLDKEECDAARKAAIKDSNTDGYWYRWRSGKCECWGRDKSWKETWYVISGSVRC